MGENLHRHRRGLREGRLNLRGYVNFLGERVRKERYREGPTWGSVKMGRDGS